MSNRRRIVYLLLGPISLALTVLLLQDAFTLPGAQAIGISVWMIFWWITRPINITVTGMIPVVANAIFNVVPMSNIVSQYTSDSIIIIFGSGLITIPWIATGLDRRVSLKALSLIGPSMKSQITVWLLASIVLSNLMPNVVVCAMLTPIAVSMLSAAGYKDIKNAAPAVPILLAIGWGVSLGGVGSPLGGAMNITAISFLEEYTGEEFMYITWIMHNLPYLVIATTVLLIGMFMMPMETKRLDGTKEFFEQKFKELGPIKRDEKICLFIFILAMSSSFARPLFADFLPMLTPAYIFLSLGFIMFFILNTEKKYLLTWEDAQAGTLWGMMILFAGGLAMGRLINDSGASARLAEIICRMSFDNNLIIIIFFVVLARVLSEVTNGTTSAAVCVPIIFSFTAELGLNPIPYWFITTMAFNAEFLLPISVRAIPISYGLNASKMLKYGIPMTIVNMAIVVLFGYFAIEYWPMFSTT